MHDALVGSLKLAASGLAAQSTRLRVAAENVANASSTSPVSGGDPYRRKTVSFEAALEDGAQGVVANEVGVDPRPFRVEYQPGHPAADAAGMVRLPNVDIAVELADMREANRAYLANLQVVKQAREAVSATLDLLRTT